ncbi:MAG: hypothetical protein A7315_09065 [Candidatus Altiarchaeales archaeon WOR_SM1_79]|nr:MAG: hypothetical protein A7315_09065 [Candidatus Altiarchaeales archaeon WOR_SM1_79]
MQTKTISFNGKELKTPNLFVSYTYHKSFLDGGLKHYPWKETNTNAILVNAYDLMKEKFEGDIHKNLNFSGPIMIDSGGYYLLSRDLNVDPRDILDVEIKSGADFGVILDYPFLENGKGKFKRIKKTLKNTEIMYAKLKEYNDKFKILPVVHGHCPRTLKTSMDGITAIMMKYNGGEIESVGIGSLAPLSRCGYPQKIKIVDILTRVRKNLPDAHIHCFSLGSAVMMHLAFYCGADTVDSQSWIVGAGYKLVQLPGFKLTRLSKKEPKFENNLKEFENHYRKLEKEEDFQIPFPIEKLIDNECNNVHYRAVHNLSVYYYEVKKIQEAIEDNKLDEFIEQRVKDTYFYNVFKYAKERVSKINT